ncbi:MAG: peptidylprolyl isomerase, partial [Gemmatimonadota bacterium]
VDTRVAVAAVSALAPLTTDTAAQPAIRDAARRILRQARNAADPILRAAATPDSLRPRRGAATPPDPAPSDPDDYQELVRRYIAPPLEGAPRPRATIETPHGLITVELLSDEAPMTVHNFISLAERGYFDGGVWHRVIPNFVLQDGAPGGDPSGGPGWTIRDEINRVRYDRGMLGMALSGPDTGGSQWFITHSPQPHLDGGYTVFGRVVDGMDAADAILQGDPVTSIRAGGVR